MADMSDVANALVAEIADIIYPQGTTASSLTGDRLLIYQGTPDAVTLASDLAAGTIHVSVFPRSGDKVTSVSHADDHWRRVSDNRASGVAILELRRQTRLFAISIWAARHDRRDAAAGAIDAGLAAVSRLRLVDGSVAVVTYDSSVQNDDQQEAGIYRRELVYALNYATTLSQTLTAITTTVTDVSPGVNGIDIATVSRTNPSSP